MSRPDERQQPGQSCYPWCVVGIGNGNRHHYEVHNLSTGEKVHTSAGKLLTSAAAYSAVYVPGWGIEHLEGYDALAHVAECLSAGRKPEGVLLVR